MKLSLFIAQLTATIIFSKTIIITIYANEKERERFGAEFRCRYLNLGRSRETMQLAGTNKL